MSKGKLCRLFFVVIGIAFLAWFVIPIFWGVLNIGNATGILVSLLIVLLAVFYPTLKRKYVSLQNKNHMKTILIILTVLFSAGILWSIFLTGCMIFGINTIPPKTATVVVLGSQVKGKEPSHDLMQRILTAEKYLKANPQAKCIVSGGKGKGEEVSEASVMKRYLIQLGVKSSRIFIEEHSTSTKENFDNTLKVIERKQFSKEVAVVTDEYHQFRAGLLAKRTGLTPYSVCAQTPWYIFSACYVRELFAITKALLLP